jgi:ADP-heptose:LPS heptosyltransferase
MPTLLYHTGALGDFMTILPALLIWKKEHPNDSLTLLGKPEIGSFGREIGYFDAAIDVTLARYAPLFSPEGSTKTTEFLTSYSNAIIFSSSDLPLAGHCRKLGLDVYDQPSFPSECMHAVDYHISLFIDPQAVPDRLRIPWIRIPQSSLEASFSLVPEGKKFCVLHGGSGSAGKNWPFERFARIADMLRKTGKNIIWIKGPAESELQFPGNDSTVENARLSTLAALLQRAEMFLGNDSGVAHLAAAVGSPSLVLFGPSDPKVWAPRGDRVRVLYNKVSCCSPCHMTGRLPRACDRACLTGISVEEVLSATAE